MNRIPTHLKGLSATEIVQQVKMVNEPFGTKAYIAFLEMHLLLAIKDALCACTNAEFGFKEGVAAEGRAIAFLNMVCPDV